MNFLNSVPSKDVASGMQRRPEQESLLDHPSSDVYFQQVSSLPMTKRVKLKSEDDDEDRRIRAAQKEKDPFLEIDVKQGSDTLHSLALKFNVPLSELKRLNNIFSENELFALKKIKIPVKPLSFLAEQIHSNATAQFMTTNEATANSDWKFEHFSTPPASSEISSPPGVSDESGDNLNHLEMSPNSRGRDNLSSFVKKNQSRQVRKTRRLLKAVDKDIASVKQKNQVIKSTVIPTRLDGWDEVEFDGGGSDDGDDERFLAFDRSESVLLLPSKHSVNVTRPPEGSKILCICCVVLIVIAVIVILVFSEYEYEVIEHRNRTDAEHNP